MKLLKTNSSLLHKLSLALILISMVFTQEAVNCPADEANTRNIYEPHDHGENLTLVAGEVITMKKSIYMGLQNKRIFCVVAADSDSEPTIIRNYNIDNTGAVLIQELDVGSPISKYFVDENELLVVYMNGAAVELMQTTIDSTTGAIPSGTVYPFSGMQGNTTTDISYSIDDIIQFDQSQIYLERTNLIIDRYTLSSGSITYDTNILLENPSTSVKCVNDAYCFDKVNRELYSWANGAKVALGETNPFLDGSDYFTYSGWEIITSIDQTAGKVYASIFAGTPLVEHQANEYTFAGDIKMYSSETPAFSTINLLFFDGDSMQILKSHYYMSVPRFITAKFNSGSDATDELGSNDDIKSIAFGNPSIFALKATQIIKISLLYDEVAAQEAVQTVVEIIIEQSASTLSTTTPITLSNKAQDNIAAVEDLSLLFTIVGVQCICISEGEMAMECFENGICLFVASMVEKDCTTGATVQTVQVADNAGTA